jgi:hypothetical protein
MICTRGFLRKETKNFKKVFSSVLLGVSIISNPGCPPQSALADAADAIFAGLILFQSILHKRFLHQ